MKQKKKIFVVSIRERKSFLSQIISFHSRILQIKFSRSRNLFLEFFFIFSSFEFPQIFFSSTFSMSSPPVFNSSTDLSSESISTLKRFLIDQGVSTENILEKSELIEKVKETLKFNECKCDKTNEKKSTEKTQQNSAENSSSQYYYRHFPVGPLSCNSILLVDRLSNRALLIDPGGDEEKIIAIIKEEKVEIILILLTHAHFDHFLAAAAISKFTGAKLAMHPDDSLLYNSLNIQCMMIGVPPPSGPPPKPDISLTDGYKLPLGDGITIHTPGHSPGSVCFYFPPLNLLASGDTLFRASVGRTDFMGGNSESLRNSIQSKLYSLPDSTVVIPGHNEPTTIGYEKLNNNVVKAKM